MTELWFNVPPTYRSCRDEKPEMRGIEPTRYPYTRSTTVLRVGCDWINSWSLPLYILFISRKVWNNRKRYTLSDTYCITNTPSVYLILETPKLFPSKKHLSIFVFKYILQIVIVHTFQIDTLSIYFLCYCNNKHELH